MSPVRVAESDIEGKGAFAPETVDPGDEGFQREYLPLPEDGFVGENRQRVERLLRRLGAGPG